MTKQHTQTHVDRDALQEQDHYGISAGLKSLYDTHADGSGYCYSTRLRPIINMRPKYSMALIGGVHQFNADLHLVDWLEAVGCPFDVVTDKDLHAEGRDLIAGYRVVLSGGLLRRLDVLVRMPVDERLRQPSLAHHQQRASALPRLHALREGHPLTVGGHPLASHRSVKHLRPTAENRLGSVLSDLNDPG